MLKIPGPKSRGRRFGAAPKSKILILLLALPVIFIWTAVLYNPVPLLRATFLDVGQGDAIFLQFPHRGNMLIDGGGGRRGDMGKRIAAYLRRQGVRRIDVLLLTHPHEDHVEGLITVLRNFPVGLVLDSGQVHASYSYEEFLRLIEKKQISYRIIGAGDKIGGFKEVEILVLHPPPRLLEGTRSDINNNSLVLRVAYGKVSLLLTGDIEREAEEGLLCYGHYLKSTIIKVPHHGSCTSSTPNFLNLVNPEIAIISVGRRNRFGHPSPRVLQRYRERGVKIYRTDKQGAILLTSDGESFRVKTIK